MTGQEIQERILQLQQNIQDSFMQDSFVLNTRLAPYYEEIAKLRQQCSHSFSNGICKWCLKKED